MPPTASPVPVTLPPLAQFLMLRALPAMPPTLPAPLTSARLTQFWMVPPKAFPTMPPV